MSEFRLPRFSIVTISYNQSEYLERAIRSVIDQEGVDLEYIVVDPGSTDGSRDIIEHYSARIQTVILSPDAGPADGLNKGLAHASGQYFGFINADDELSPGALREAAAFFQLNPDIDVVCGDSWQIDADGQRSRRLVSVPHISPRLFARGVAYIVQQSAFMRLPPVLAIGGFDKTNCSTWDGDLFYRLAKQGSRFKRVKHIWGLFRIYGTSISGSGRLIDIYRKERRAMFIQQFGRTPNYSDTLIAHLLYVFITISDLHALRWKLLNRINGR
jgi:glycosyltransferase involved in cell wall biosynthesis